MKRLSILQVVLGGFAILDSILLWPFRKEIVYPIGPGGYPIVPPGPRPVFYLDVLLVILGLAIVLTGLALRAKKARYSTLQVIFGQDIAIISFILYRIAINNSGVYPHWLFWLVYVVMGTAVAVVFTAVSQLVSKNINSMPNNGCEVKI